MSSLVGRPDESMNIELASSSYDSEDEEDDNNMLDDVEAGVAEAARPPRPTKARNAYSIAHEDIVEVWARFKSTVESYTTKPNTVGMMLAWNGKASDCNGSRITK